ncbi:MAG: dephospho-CoA kinase [Armatimonadota bacterium]|nr:dephospho-CoA kinase [Armatimonadota bacterium]
MLNQKDRRLVIGVTGGIASGKSTVLEMLRKRGAETLSADQVARQILARGEPAYHEVLERFGTAVIDADGNINRSRLAEIVFADEQARHDLNRITHPRIIERIRSAIEEFRKGTDGNGVLAVEIPLLYECGLEDIVDCVLVVAAEQGIQVHRLTTRTGITSEEALRRINSQMPMSEKVRRADFVVWNNGSLQELEQAVDEFWKKVCCNARVDQ